MTTNPNAVEVPAAVMQAAERAAVDAINAYAAHRGATAGAQQRVIDGLNAMTGVGRLDLAMRLAQAAVTAAAPLIASHVVERAEDDAPACRVCGDGPKPGHYCADCGRQGWSTR